MRTTLTIDDDVLRAAKERARREGVTAGAVISQLARRALTLPLHSDAAEPVEHHGFRPLPSRGGLVTAQLVDGLQDDE